MTEMTLRTSERQRNLRKDLFNGWGNLIMNYEAVMKLALERGFYFPSCEVYSDAQTYTHNASQGAIF